MARRPRPRRPPLPRIPGIKAPDWWQAGVAAARGYPVRELRWSETREPAGDPPAEWPGTRPEWAVYWALLVLGLREGLDFTYRQQMPELEANRYGEVDFLVWTAGVAIEVQGVFWHYGVGQAKQAGDTLRRALVASSGLVMVWVDADDALSDPVYYTREALAGRDHSRGGEQ